MEETAKCRNCGKKLIGKPYHLGGGAYDPKTMDRIPINFFGGYVCSENCDRKICLEMLSSMPGAGPAKHLDTPTRDQVERNWAK